MKLAFTIMCMCAVFAGMVYSVYATAFFGWVTATPLTSTDLARVKWVSSCWFAASIACFSLWIATTVSAVRQFRNVKPERENYGFDVVQ